jgi:hypothetical protein
MEQWIFHPAEKGIDISPGPAIEKGGLKILFM